MAGYKILIDNSKKNDILKVEGVCPICNHYPSTYIEVTDSSGNRQFKYSCPKCDSKWQGNMYDSQLRMINPHKVSIIQKLRKVALC